jgi:predicted GNAT superfamily acetyltransferase
MCDQEEQERISIQESLSLTDMRVCVDLQRAIWNDSDQDLIPSSLFIVARKIGGHVLLARDKERAVGFALAFPAFRNELRFLHSHMVGILPEYQNCGLGRRIKQKQREWALSAQITHMEWTFDPLAMRNAHFNVARLGAVIRGFYPNLYGVTASPLHNGLPTDRLVAEWWMDSPRVRDALAGKEPAVSNDAIEIRIPQEMEIWKATDVPRAVEAQASLRSQFQERFAQGLAVTGFRSEAGSGVYLLEPL